MKENDRLHRKTEWKMTKLEGGGILCEKPIDPSIMAQMPQNTETFVSRGFFRVASYELRKILYDIEMTLKGGSTTTPPSKI